MGRKIDKESVYKSLSIIVLAALVICVTAIVLFYANNGVTGIDAAFEAVAAISTGLSTGVCGKSGIISKIILLITMFIGRVGPFSFAISMSHDSHIQNEVYPEGKMMVG